MRRNGVRVLLSRPVTDKIQAFGTLCAVGKNIKRAEKGSKKMAKGKFRGIVVGGASWEIEKADKSKMTGYSYKVMTLDEFDEKTGLHGDVSIVSVGTESKQFDPNIKYLSEVEFEGEFRSAFKDQAAKMQYGNLRLVKGGKNA